MSKVWFRCCRSLWLPWRAARVRWQEETPTTSATSPDLTTEPPVTGTATPTSAPAPSTGKVFGPKSVTVAWNCEALDPGGGESFRFACSNDSTAAMSPEFRAGNWVGTVTTEVNEQNEPVAITVTARGYNGNCEWNPAPGTAFEGDLIDGQATISGVLVGTGRCEGLQFVFEAVWEDESGNFAMDGEVELVG